VTAGRSAVVAGRAGSRAPAGARQIDTTIWRSGTWRRRRIRL